MVNNELKELIYRRPAMFIGSEFKGDTWNEDAIHALIKLVVQQMVAPETGNHPTYVNIVLQSARTIILEDDGNGLPIAPLTGFPNSTTPVLVDLLNWHMPTGIPSEEQYKEFGFISYFATLLNVFSDRLTIDTVRDNIVYIVTCSRGEIVKPFTKSDTPILESGTRITFEPDTEYFSKFSFDLQKLEKNVNNIKLQHDDIVFNVLDKREA